MVSGSSAKEGGGNQLGVDRVDLGRSRFDRIGGELEVHARRGEGSLVAVGRQHDGTRLCAGGSQLASLGREQVLADRLGLGHGIALVAEGNVERSIFGGSRKYLDHVVALEALISVGVGGRNDSSSLDGVLNVRHLRCLVIGSPVAHGGRETKVVVLDRVGFAVVLASSNGEVVRDNKVEGNLVSLAGLEDVVLGNIRLRNGHAKLHEGSQ